MHSTLHQLWSRLAPRARYTAAPAGVTPTERRLRDAIAPGAIEETPTYLRLDDRFQATLAVVGYPRDVGVDWLAPLLRCGLPLRVSLHPHPVPTERAKRAMLKQQAWLAADDEVNEREGRVGSAATRLGQQDAAGLEEALELRTERLYECSLYIAVTADTLAQLEARQRQVEEELGGMGLRSIRLRHQQAPGLQATLPLALDAPRRTHPMTAAALAASFPFATAGARGGPVLLGTNLHSGGLVDLDPFDRGQPAWHLPILGPSGGGKSYAAKLLILRTLPLRPDGADSGCDAWVVDPEGEFVNLARLVGGRVIALTAGDHGVGLNPLDLPPAEEQPDPDTPAPSPVAERMGAVAALVGLLVGQQGALDATEQAIVLQATALAYARQGITTDPATHGRPAPTLADVQEMLAAGADLDREGAADPALLDRARHLGFRLKPYTHGEFRGLFARRTEGEFSGRVVCWNVRQLPRQLEAAGLFLLTDALWTQLRRQRRNRLLVVDEAHKVTASEAGGQLLSDLAERGRKYNLALLVVAQDVKKLLASPHGRAVAVNSARCLLPPQNEHTIPILTEAFSLGQGEADWLTYTARRGQALLLARDRRIAVQILASPAEHEAITTDPTELLAREQARRRTLQRTA